MKTIKVASSLIAFTNDVSIRRLRGNQIIFETALDRHTQTYTDQGAPDEEAAAEMLDEVFAFLGNEDKTLDLNAKYHAFNNAREARRAQAELDELPGNFDELWAEVDDELNMYVPDEAGNGTGYFDHLVLPEGQTVAKGTASDGRRLIALRVVDHDGGEGVLVVHERYVDSDKAAYTKTTAGRFDEGTLVKARLEREHFANVSLLLRGRALRWELDRGDYHKQGTLALVSHLAPEEELESFGQIRA